MSLFMGTNTLTALKLGCISAPAERMKSPNIPSETFRMKISTFHFNGSQLDLTVLVKRVSPESQRLHKYPKP